MPSTNLQTAKPTVEEMLDRALSNQNDIMCALRSVPGIPFTIRDMLSNSQHITLDMLAKIR